MTDGELPRLPPQPEQPPLPPPPTPEWGVPQVASPPPPPPTSVPPPGPQQRSQRGWIIAAALVAGLVAVQAVGRAVSADEDIGFVVGTAVGTLGFLAVIGAIVGRLKSLRAGLIAVVIVGGLVAAGNIARNVNERGTVDEINTAAEDLGIATGEPIDFTADELDCLDATDFEPDDLLTAMTDTGAEGTARQLEWLDVVAECAPRVMMTDANLEQFRQTFSSGMNGEITDDETRCILEEISQAPKPSDLLGSDDADEIAAVVLPCLGEESLALLRGDEGTGPQAIGDDPAFDRLAERCRDDVDIACDLLFASASTGSAYSELAWDCAGRGAKSTTACAAGFVDDDNDGALDDASTGWARVTDDCRTGDMLACDFIYALTEIGGVHERIGETCGERRALATAESCVERYGETAD